MFIFKRKIFGFMDLLRFKNMIPKRRKALEEGSSKPLPKSYRVNETARVLHPGYQNAKIVSVKEETADMKTLVFETERPLYFHAGQYVTLSAQIGESFVSRPYAISSAPAAALERKVCITVKKEGFFSGYLVDDAKAGDVLLMGDPSGDFCYDGVRDSKTVVGVAGGSGITPFYALAQAIADGTEECSLVLFYGARTEKDIAFKSELDALCGEKIKVVYVLSDEVKEGYESGFVSAALMKKYVSGDFTLMACGPQAMYNFLDGEAEKMGLTRRRFRKEAGCVGVRDCKPAAYTLTVHIGFERYTVKADARETVLVALERAGLRVPSKCRAGECGFYHSRLISGKFTIAGEDKRRLADEKFGYFHPCCSYPDSDMEIEVPKLK